jgi:hypothetical protein
MFKFVKYGKLYPPQAWADLKFLSMDRHELALGMLKHTKNPIHHSLTQINEEDKLTQKLAKEMFKNIMGCQSSEQRQSKAEERTKVNPVFLPHVLTNFTVLFFSTLSQTWETRSTTIRSCLPRRC